MKWEKRLDRVLETLVTLMFFSILMLTILLVIMRYGFNSSIIGGNEAMNYLFIYTTALGAAVSVGQGTHIKISFVVDHLPDRARRVVDMIGYGLIAVDGQDITAGCMGIKEKNLGINRNDVVTRCWSSV